MENPYVIENKKMVTPVSDVSPKTITDIFIIFAKGLMGSSEVAKIGVELLSFAIDYNGNSNGPSWEDIKKMTRTIVREELITNDLEGVQGVYAKVISWLNTTYLPQKKNNKSEQELWAILSPQIDEVLNAISLLKQTNHRMPGFPQLIYGVNMYLTLLQEQISINQVADIKGAGNEWADTMVQIQNEIIYHRSMSNTVTKTRYVAASFPTVYAYYWNWTDLETGETKGDKSGPWTQDSSNVHEQECRVDLYWHVDSVVNQFKSNLNLIETEKAWRNIK